MPYYLQQTLSQMLHKDITIILTDNQRTIMSVRYLSNNELTLRIHRIFRKPDYTLLNAICNFIENKEDTSIRYIKQLFKDYCLSKRTTDSVQQINKKLIAEGRVYNLQSIYDHINQVYFHGNLHFPIGWARRTNKKRQYSIRLGSFTAQENVIKIHPKLDSDQVPNYVVESVVHHEMVHGYLNQEGHSLRHTKKFKKLEKSYLDYHKAAQWIRKNKKIFLANS